MDVKREQALQMFLRAAQIQFDFAPDKLLINWKLCAISVQILCNLCANIGTQTKQTDKVYTKPIYCTSVQKTSLLYTVQVYTRVRQCQTGNIIRPKQLKMRGSLAVFFLKTAVSCCWKAELVLNQISTVHFQLPTFQSPLSTGNYSISTFGKQKVER